MSSVKKILRYSFNFLLVITIAFLFFDFAKRYHNKIPFFQSNTPTSVDVESIKNAEIATLKEEISRQSTEISRILQMITEINQTAAKSEKYSKLLLILTNLHNSLLMGQKINVEFEIKALIHLTKGDSQLANIFTPLISATEIYGIKYYEKQFNSISRNVMADHFKNDNDNKTLIFLKQHFLPYFTYISSDSSHISQTLNNARTHLKNVNMVEFQNNLQSIHTKNEAFEKYTIRLEEFMKIWNAIEQSKIHITNLLVLEEEGI
jgi:hypothetical protein